MKNNKPQSTYFIINKHSRDMFASITEDYIFHSLGEARNYLYRKEGADLHEVNEFLYESSAFCYTVKELKVIGD